MPIPPALTRLLAAAEPAVADAASQLTSLKQNWGIALVVALVLMVVHLIYIYSSRAGIIARATTKEALRQPVFILTLAIMLIVLVVNTFLPFFSLGDDVKMLKDCGLATMLICGMLMAVWTSSTSIADEIEGKTAMTLLSKPINRRQFIVGKYLGILQSVLILLIPTAICFLGLIFYKVGYDAREGGGSAPEQAEKIVVVVQILPGIILTFLEITVLTAVSVAISTRLPMVVNMTTCFAIFVVGHLTTTLVQSGVVKLELVLFMAQLIATVLPGLDNFNSSASVSIGSIIPADYIAYAALYCAAYSTAAILLAFILFEDRDLA